VCLGLEHTPLNTEDQANEPEASKH
jgi:hypothetical protein